MATTTTDSQAASAEPATPRDIPKAGWFAILRRAVKQFKHDDVTDKNREENKKA